MVLNHASLVVNDHYEAMSLLKDVVEGMTYLIDKNVVEQTLRTSAKQSSAIYNLLIGKLYDFDDAEFRDTRKFLLSLSTKSPLLRDVDNHYKDRFKGCEYVSHTSQYKLKLTPEEGAPLVLCAVTNWIAVGIASKNWDCERIVVHFKELKDDSSIGQVSERINNLTRSHHASAIYKTHYNKIQSALTVATFWEERNSAFPYLLFGCDVKAHIQNINAGELSVLVSKLNYLNQECKDWQSNNSYSPDFNTIFSRESQTVRKKPYFREKRMFTSSQGATEYYELHIRFGTNGRIHCRICQNVKRIEVGYIGPHLPTKKYPK